MEFSRLPRFKRDSDIGPMQITERDRAIIRLVHRNRFLRSSHILALLDGGSQQILRRLQLLYHHGFLERPRSQIEYYRRGGSRRIVYGLGNKGASLLREELGATFRTLPWGEKNAAVRRPFFEHALLVSDIMVALELGCRKRGDVHLLADDDLPLQGGAQTGLFKFSVKVENGAKLGVNPDRVFTLESEGIFPSHSPAFFFLEADRGTMPIVRKNLSQSSFYRKLLAYEATWTQGLHRSRFGFHRFRVLTVTTSEARVQSMVEACSQLRRGHGLFLFTDQASLQAPGDIFTLPWKTGRPGEIARILP
jgi:hypothetical protein